MRQDWADRFGFIFCCDMVHDTWDPDDTLREIHRVLKPGEYFSMMESNVHSNVKDNIGKAWVTHRV